jgi:hypothetical protein
LFAVVALAAIILARSAYADFTIQLDAGRLRVDSATAMTTGSLLVLVAAGGDNTFSNNLSPGHYVAGNDILLGAASLTAPNGAGSFNGQGGVDETNNVFNISTTSFPTVAANDLLGLRWFPQITFAQFVTGGTPSAGQLFGFYNPLFWGNADNNPDHVVAPTSSPWAVPASGALINLDFFTTNSTGGGTQNPTEGYATFSVTAVPESSTVACAFLCACGLGFHAFRRSRARTA